MRPPIVTATTIETTVAEQQPQPQPQDHQPQPQPQQQQATFALEYDITDQTIAQQPNVIPMIVTSSDTNDASFGSVTMELAYQTA